MLKGMRKLATTWLGKLAFGVLVVGFAAWGIGDIFVSRHSGAIASVDGREISGSRYSMALRNQMSRIEQQIGRPLTVEQARTFGLDRAALSDLVRQESMFAEAEDLGVSASDLDVKLSIALNPAFHNALGEFDPNQYRQTLEFSRVSPAEYEEGQRRALASNAVGAFAAVGYELPAAMADRLNNFNNETRRFHYVILGREAAGEIAAADDAALQAHVEAHPERFSSPEFRKARYVLASVDGLAAKMSATDDEAKEIYEVRKTFYNTPESRELRRIVFKTDEEANAAKARLAEGVSFLDLATEKGLSAADTALGDGPASTFEAAVADAAFAAAGPGVIGPVATGFGPALIDVVSIASGSQRSFEDVRDELLDTVRRDKALEEIVQIRTEIGDFVTGGADLDLISRNLGLELGETPLLDSAGASPDGAAAGPAKDPAFLSALFGAKEGAISQPISLADDSIVVFSVAEIVPPSLRPLEEVRAAAAESLEAEKVAAALAARAAEILQRVDQGALLAAEADALGQTLSTSDTLTRSASTADLPSDLVHALFGKPAGGAASAPLDNGARVVVAQVFEIETPTGEEADAEKAALATQIDTLAQQDVQELLTRATVAGRDVSVNTSALEQALSNIGGNAR